MPFAAAVASMSIFHHVSSPNGRGHHIRSRLVYTGKIAPPAASASQETPVERIPIGDILLLDTDCARPDTPWLWAALEPTVLHAWTGIPELVDDMT